MPRLILGPDTKVRDDLTSVSSRPNTKGANDLSVQYYLRKKRSPGYIKFFKGFDVMSRNVSAQFVQQVLDEIRNEFPELGIDQFPIGFVSKCYLGHPYEVHILDLALKIVEHYKEYEAMPPEYEKARRLALNPAYILIEVYPCTLRAISENGDVSVI